MKKKNSRLAEETVISIVVSDENVEIFSKGYMYREIDKFYLMIDN